MYVGIDVVYVYGGMLGMLILWVELYRILYEGILVGIIKKYVIGKGNVSKVDVIVVMRVLGYVLVDYNEVDVLVLLYFCMMELEECGFEDSI